MGYRDREIEIKMLVKDTATMKDVDKNILKLMKKHEIDMCKPIIKGSASDTYWDAPEDSHADFVRLRELDDVDEKGCDSQITIKYTDRGGNFNRVEVDVPIGDWTKGKKLLTYLMGDPLGTVTKDYTVYFLEDEHTTISVYQILKDSRVFVEVEAKTARRARELAEMVLEYHKCERVHQSLFQMFVRKETMTTEPI